MFLRRRHAEASNAVPGERTSAPDAERGEVESSCRGAAPGRSGRSSSACHARPRSSAPAAS
eukprot:5915770-Prymnesium_polylepis.1